MRKIIDVQTGQVKAEKGRAILESRAIGSCIVVAAYDSGKKIGAMAHIMLPGNAPVREKKEKKTKYAAQAIDTIVMQMADLGAKSKNISVVMVGGANVLKRKNDTISKENIHSTTELLREKQLRVKAKAVGGTNRRSISLDIGAGIVYYTEGDSDKIELWRTECG